MIAFGMTIAGVAGVLGAWAPSTGWLLLSRAFVGLGTASVVPLANSILGELFEGPAKASRMAIFNLGLLFGGAVGFNVGMAVGFPDVVVVLAVPGIALGLLVLALPIAPRVTIDPSASGSLSQHFSSVAAQFFHDGRVLLRIRTLRYVIASAIAMAFAAGGFNAWLIDLLEQDKHMSKQAATNLLVVSMFGAIGGILGGGRLADRLRKRMPTGRLWTIAIGMTATTPCTAACLLLPPGPMLYIAGVAVMFFISWYHAPMAVSVDDLAPPSRAVSAQGLVIGLMHLAGTAPSSYVVGLISDHASLFVAMWLPAGALVIAAVCMALATSSFARDAGKARGAVL